MKKQYIIVLLFFLATPAALQAREFLNTVVHLNFGGMYTFSSKGDMLDSEKSEVNSSIPDNTDISHYETAYCATLDIVPTDPIILGMEGHAIKFGVRGSYGFHYLQQRVTSGADDLGDEVMNYRAWMIGPVIHYAPFIEPSDLNEDYTASGGFTIFALYGKINGDLTAYPSVREVNKYTGGDYDTEITGYKYDIGVGAEISLCSLNVGVNVYYTKININMKDEVYTDLGKKGSLREGCLEIYVGIPIESFIEPLIPKF